LGPIARSTFCQPYQRHRNPIRGRGTRSPRSAASARRSAVRCAAATYAPVTLSECPAGGTLRSPGVALWTGMDCGRPICWRTGVGRPAGTRPVLPRSGSSSARGPGPPLPG